MKKENFVTNIKRFTDIINVYFGGWESSMPDLDEHDSLVSAKQKLPFKSRWTKQIRDEEIKHQNRGRTEKVGEEGNNYKDQKRSKMHHVLF